MALQFSDRPGSRERHLRRRCDNPLFPPDRRSITQAQVDVAREADETEYREFRERFRQLLHDAGEMSGSVDTEKVLALKERIEQLYEQCAGFGGDHEQEKQGLLRLNDVIMGAVRRAAGNDPLAIEELNNEQAARQLHLQLLEYPLVADLLRDDTPIEAQDLVPTLLSEDPESVRVVMSLFEPDQQTRLQTEAAHLVQRAESEGALEARAQASYEAMASPLQ